MELTEERRRLSRGAKRHYGKDPLMPDVHIYAPSGDRVGTFQNAAVTMAPDHHYVLRGRFLEADGTPAQRIEFNPEVLPYTADISGVSKCSHKKLVAVFVQRGRQPVEMTGVCAQD